MSAFFLMTSDAVVDRAKELARTHAQLIHTNLSNDQEAALHEVFAEE